MKVNKAAFDDALDRLIRTRPLPLSDIPKADGSKRKPAKKATRKR